MSDIYVQKVPEERIYTAPGGGGVIPSCSMHSSPTCASRFNVIKRATFVWVSEIQ